MTPDALLILVGVTADRAKRRHLLADVARRQAFAPYLPCLPFRLGLGACARWLPHYIRTRVLPRGHRAIHVLNYVGGGYAYRLAATALAEFPIGRVIFIRSPLQERVPRRAVERWSAPAVWLAAGKAVVDMARDEIIGLPIPALGRDRGLIVEMRPSAMARSLGIDREALPPAAWDHAAMLPGAADTVALPVSHDDAYSDPLVLDQVHAFMTTGRFRHDIADDAGQR